MRGPRRLGSSSESLTARRGGLKEEQSEVGPKGAASGAMQGKDCREAVPKEEQVWETCESKEWERVNQMDADGNKRGAGEVEELL